MLADARWPVHLARRPQDVDGDEDTVSEIPFGFWASETLWANMEGLTHEDVDLGCERDWDANRVNSRVDLGLAGANCGPAF
ncbi:hypothetical protein V8D89_009983 [Ganoderma adspersum]